MRFLALIAAGCVALSVALVIEGATDSAAAAWAAFALLFFVMIMRTLYLSGFGGDD